MRGPDLVRSAASLGAGRYAPGAAAISVVIVAACGGGGSNPPADADDQQFDASDPGEPTLAENYPGDVGLGADPAVIWFEAFDEADVGAVTARYDSSQGQAYMQLVGSGPAGAALALTAGTATNDAVDLYKQLPDHGEWWVRWYVKYEPGIQWHHSGMWFGGYNPGMSYPSPMAGYRPNGDDRVSFSIEPVWNTGGATGARFDFYNYWMTMHSWMPDPVNNDGTAYYGNALIHRNDFTIDEDSWSCLEVHIVLNPNAGSGDGAMIEVWKNDAQVVRFDDAGPMGYWIRDKFCPMGADGSECTDYPAPFDTILDRQFRSTTALALNAFWPQNYITDVAQGTMTLDQMVVATSRIGCLR